MCLIAGVALNVKSELQLYQQVKSSTPEKIDILVNKIKSGKVNLSNDQLISYLESEKELAEADNNFLITAIDVWESLAIVLITISLLYYILLGYLYYTSTHSPNKSLKPETPQSGAP